MKFFKKTILVGLTAGLSLIGLSSLYKKGVLPPIFREDNLKISEIEENMSILSGSGGYGENILEAVIGEDYFNKQLINSKKHIKIGIQEKLYDFYGDNIEMAANEYNKLFDELKIDYHLSCEKMDSALGYDIVVADDFLNGKIWQKSYQMINLALNSSFSSETFFSTIMVRTDIIEKPENTFYRDDEHLTGAFMHELGHALFNFIDNDEPYNTWGCNPVISFHNKFTHFDIYAIASKTMNLSDSEQLKTLYDCVDRRMAEFKEAYPNSSYTKRHCNYKYDREIGD